MNYNRSVYLNYQKSFYGQLYLIWIINIQISKKGQISTAFVFAFIMTLLTSSLGRRPHFPLPAVHDNGNQKSKDKNKPKDPKCNNVQILLNVSKMPKGSKLLVAQATLDGKTVNKKQHVEGDNKVAITLSFKKLNPYPVVGGGFAGSVNGTNFNGTLTSVKKPNKVNVVPTRTLLKKLKII